ncbi:MAG: nucleotidyltransferase family protein [Planctomycetes bacterium]|nr:nucleotidyltransferase family protein [Planctomycetota bacterium]
MTSIREHHEPCDRDATGMTSALIVVVLAAGRSSRMGSPKPLIMIDGEPALVRVLRIARTARLRAQVVLGFFADEVRSAIDLRGVAIVTNPAPELGQSSSIRCGAAALPPGAAMVLWPVDHARVTEATFVALLAAFRARGQGIELVAPSYCGRRGHPLLAGSAAVDELRTLPPDAPAHTIVRRDPARVHHVSVADRMVVDDFDTPEDLRA